MSFSWLPYQDLLWTSIAIASAGLAGVLLHQILRRFAAHAARRPDGTQGHVLISHVARPAGASLTFVLILAVVPALPFSARVVAPAHHLVLLCLIGALGWFTVGFIGYLEHLVTCRYQADAPDNIQGRRIRTQVQLFRRIAEACVFLGVLAIMLMTFPTIWSLGASMLASAGVAGLVIGMAARPALSNLVAGVQMALTEPMRIDDVVIVEGEWGQIEEMNTTYVVIRTWDLRRLIVPLTYFMEKPFQNWTRTSTNLIGSVFIHADYSVPVEDLRAELERVVGASELWDRRTCVLQVTEAKEQSIELRALVSATSAPRLWDLRCHTREKLVRFLQERHPSHLPRMRAEVWDRAGGDARQDGNGAREPSATRQTAPFATLWRA